jgi:hypothetical protein
MVSAGIEEAAMRLLLTMAALALLGACTNSRYASGEKTDWKSGTIGDSGWAHSELQGEWQNPSQKVNGPVIINGRRVSPE